MTNRGDQHFCRHCEAYFAEAIFLAVLKSNLRLESNRVDYLVEDPVGREVRSRLVARNESRVDVIIEDRFTLAALGTSGRKPLRLPGVSSLPAKSSGGFGDDREDSAITD